jgi:hypothetical protein
MRIRRGQIIEVVTPRGLAYVQYVSRHRKYGDTIRALPGLFGARPKDFSGLARKHAYFAFYPVGAAVTRGFVAPVATEAIPTDLEEPRRMRRRGAISRDGRVLAWLIVEGDHEVLRHELSDEEKRLPIASIWNHAYLVDRLAEEWSPEMDDTRRETLSDHSAPAEPTASLQVGTSARVTHYLYFPAERSARVAAQELTGRGFEATTRPSVDIKNWLVLAKHDLPNPDLLYTFRSLAEGVAGANSGKYDGSEVEFV